ncbi:MAG: carbohydrate binding family 9 domain-containing protein [Flavobacteriales bacterium]|nr:carbohydrate binding family 9 domain-containing protein [Flavobacteriales bacterium]
MKKELSAQRINETLVIDGILEESFWAEAQGASGFIQNRPNPGTEATEKSVVKILYDDEFLYVGAEMYDSNPDSILHQLSARDNLENSDMFGLWISSFKDGINAFEFMVTPDGVQLDALVSTNGEDFNWNAVWQCNTRIHSTGWTAEFKIPYSAFRFAEAEEQVWDVNFFRTIRRRREQSFWQFVDPAAPGFIQQSGTLNNIKDIEPPIRLFFYPYASGYYETSKNDEGVRQEGTQFNGGMDIKYGINESFTLDMTLIPDFGQVQSDNQVLNLSPFEVRFNENRQFFTEGTELFSKGNLFYSRRIGEAPINASDVEDDLKEGETVKEIPIETQLLNASKISGRNKNGLGFGMLNAVVNSAYAVIEDSLGNTREVQVAPFTNYNIMVLDQNIRNNGYLSLINTTLREMGAPMTPM